MYSEKDFMVRPRSAHVSLASTAIPPILGAGRIPQAGGEGNKGTLKANLRAKLRGINDAGLLCQKLGQVRTVLLEKYGHVCNAYGLGPEDVKLLLDQLSEEFLLMKAG